MDLAELTARVDKLTSPARQRMLTDIARSLAGTGELDALLAELGAEPGIARGWAIDMAVRADRGTYLLRRATSTADLAEAVPALRYCVSRRLGFDAFAGLLPDAPTAWRHALYRALRSAGVQDWADRLLPVVRARFGDREAAAVLPVCDGATVAELLPELDFAVPSLRALARRHPGVVLAHLGRQLAQSDQISRAWVWRGYAAATPELARHDPIGLLDLLARLGPLTGPPAGLQRWLPALIRAAPDRVAAILADPRRRIQPATGRAGRLALRLCPDDTLIAIARSRPAPDLLATLLRGLPPARRTPVFLGALGDRDLVRAGWPLTLLDLLPWPARHAMARTLAATRHVTDDPRLRAQVAARLPWAEAEPLLRKATAHSSATERSLAYPLLIAAAAATRDPEIVGGLLASLSRLPNEQEPVRRSALAAIAAIPAWLFRVADLPVLLTIATDAVQARDASWQTQQAISDIGIGLIRQGGTAVDPSIVDFGVRLIELSGRHNHGWQFHRLDRSLPRGGEFAVLDALRARIAQQATVGRYLVALDVATALHKRAWRMPELQGYVGQAMTATDDNTIRRAIDLWLAPPATRAERVAVVFGLDRSTIVIDSVAGAISRTRTDLLDQVLSGSLGGRFLQPHVRLLPIFRGSLRQWSPRQLTIYARRLGEIAGGRREPVWERVSAIHRTSTLPGMSGDPFRLLAQDRDVTVVEAALAALGRTDQPDRDLTDLLGYAGTDRARVAVHAAARCANRVPPARLAEVLRPVLAGRKVTSRKEAVRLVAGHQVPGAMDELVALWADPSLHRDIRRTIVSAARSLLDDGRVWTLLAGAVDAGHAVAIGLALTRPATIPPAHRARYGALVRAVAVGADPDAARTGLAAWLEWCAWDRDGAADMARIIGDLAGTATWRDAVRALVEACAVTGDPAVPLALLDALVRDRSAAPDRDLPATQRLRHLAEYLGTRVDTAGDALRPTAAALVARLTGHPDFVVDGLELAVAALPDRHGDLPGALRAVVAMADRPVLAWLLADRVATWLAGHDPARPGLSALARELAGTEDGALVAVAVAGVAGAHAGWPSSWRELVAELRGSADPDVRERALRIVTVPE